MKEYQQKNQKLIESLSNYGLVRTCKQVNDVVIVIITEGFSENFIKTSEAMGLIQKEYPDHSIVETMISEENFCHVVFKRPTLSCVNVKT